jgi:hypothetical protein
MRISPVIRFAGLALMIFATLGAASAQQPATAAQQQAQPIYHLTVVGETITAVNYQHRSGSTMIDF